MQLKYIFGMFDSITPNLSFALRIMILTNSVIKHDHIIGGMLLQNWPLLADLKITTLLGSAKMKLTQ